METQYFVFYQRDRKGEGMVKAKGRMLYDSLKEFMTQEEATTFALSKLQDSPIMAKKVNSLSDYDVNSKYVVAAYFDKKYEHCCYDGSSDYVTTNEVVKCKQNNLDSVIEELASENPANIRLGIEEKVIPTALDRIRSVNGK